MKPKIKRKVTCVYGKFDNKSDFVLEPAVDGEPYFWIEGTKAESEKKETNLDKALRLLFDVKIISNLSKFIYSWMFILIFTLGIIGFQAGVLHGYFEVFMVGAILFLFIYLWDLQVSNYIKGAYWIPIFFQMMWFFLEVTNQNSNGWIAASWKSAIFITILVLIYKYWWKKDGTC